MCNWFISNNFKNFILEKPSGMFFVDDKICKELGLVAVSLKFISKVKNSMIIISDIMVIAESESFTNVAKSGNDYVVYDLKNDIIIKDCFLKDKYDMKFDFYFSTLLEWMFNEYPKYKSG